MKFSYKKPKISEVEAPILPIQIFDDTRTHSYPNQATTDALIDTGYDGFIMIPIKIFDALNLISSELPQDQVSMAETIVGEHLELRTALGYVEIPKLKISLSLEIDTYSNCAEILLGRQFLEYLVITLDGQQKELIIE